MRKETFAAPSVDYCQRERGSDERKNNKLAADVNDKDKSSFPPLPSAAAVAASNVALPHNHG